MAKKKIWSCLAQCEKLAKAGKTQGTYAVYEDDVKWLEGEGFTVIMPNIHKEATNKKNPLEVTICWDKPAHSGLAKRFYKLVEKYRQKQNVAKLEKKYRKGLASAKRMASVTASTRISAGVNWLSDIEEFDDECGEDEIVTLAMALERVQTGE